MIIIISLIGVFYLTTLRPGQPWGDDFAMYILQARNIASGNWTAPTGYIYNPGVPRVGPPAYPPLFPLALSPLYRMWGLNLMPMKVEVVLFFLAALYLMFEFLSRQEPFPYAMGIVAALGVSPYFWEFKESILSDLPFFFFSSLTLCVISACDRQLWKSAAGAGAAAACVYLCFATRTVGVVFIPCLLLSVAPRLGEVRRKALFATAAAVVLIGVHIAVFRDTASYLDQVGAHWRALPDNLMAYSWVLRHRFFGLADRVFSWVFLLAFVALGAIGLTHRLKRGISLAEVFTLSYALIVLLWTNAVDLRFLIPLLPMWFLYITVAVRNLAQPGEFILGGLLVAVIVGGYALRFSLVDFGPIREGLGDPAFARICDDIRGQTAAGSVIIFDRPRLLALVTGRNVSAYHEPTDDRELWSYFSGISANYALIDREFPDDRSYLEPILLRYPSRAHETRVEGSFHLYTLR